MGRVTKADKRCRASLCSWSGRGRCVLLASFAALGLVCLALFPAQAADVFFFAARHASPWRGPCLPREPGEGGRGPVGDDKAFGVLSFHHRKDAMRAASWANKEAYCAKWGYTCFDGNTWATTDGGTFNKLHFIIETMESPKAQGLEWLLWIDGDAHIANTDVKLSDLLRGLPRDDENTTMAIAADALTINTGVFLIRNNSRGRMFASAWLAQRSGLGIGSKYNVDDQRTLISIYNARARELGLKCEPGHFPFGARSELSCHDQASIPEVLVLTPCALNSGPGLEWKPGSGPYFQGMYMHGDFVVHFFGQGHRKIELMKKAANKDFFWARR